MARFILLRLAQAIPLLLVLSVLTFGLLTAAPGDPAQAILSSGSGPRVPREEDVARLRVSLGLDRPVPERYVRWLGRSITGDFGTSYVKGRPVADILREVIPPTLLLTGTALVVTILLAIPLGLVAGLRPGSGVARAIGALVLALYSTPSFVTGLLAILVFSVLLRVLPSGGMTTAGEAVSLSQVARHLILPALVLALGHHLAAYIRLVEAAVTEARHADHVLGAVARGLPRRVVAVTHILRPSLVPFVAQVGASFGSLIGGAYALEAIFAWPGMGRAALAAANGRDYPVLMAIVLLTGTMVVLGNLLADVAVGLIDPRVRLVGSEA